MNKQTVCKSISITGLLLTCYSTGIVHAEWNNDSAFNGYNPGYGNFPPEDIEQKLFGQMDAETRQYLPQNQNELQDKAWPKPRVNQYAAPAPTPGYSQNYSQQDFSQQADTPANYPGEQAYQQPRQQSRQQAYQQPQQYKTSPYDTYPVPPQANNRQANTRSMGLSTPWNNNNTGFTMPWGNNSSAGNMMPWGNRQATPPHFATRNPWDNLEDNNSTGFTTPWTNQGSSFSMPWGGNNSRFSPWNN